MKTLMFIIKNLYDVKTEKGVWGDEKEKYFFWLQVNLKKSMYVSPSYFLHNSEGQFWHNIASKEGRGRRRYH